METVFLRLLNMSIAASWLVLAVFLLRPLLKKAPKALRCVLWAIVAVRLICPFSIESALSLIPSAQTVSPDIIYSQETTIYSGIPALNQVVNPVISSSFAPDPAASVNPLQIWSFLAAVVWLVGLIAMLTYLLISYLRLCAKVKEAVPLRDNLWLCDAVRSPFIEKRPLGSN